MSMTEQHADGAQPNTVYEVVGGTAFFVALVERFYASVAADALLRPLYPDDLRDAKAHLAGFLVQYWGGPTTYSDERGHPRLRMRHAPFVIGQAEADAWFAHMTTAVAMSPVADDVRAVFLEYFERSAAAMINVVS